MKLVWCSLCPVTRFCRFSEETASNRLGLHPELSAKEKQDALYRLEEATRNCPLRKIVEPTVTETPTDEVVGWIREDRGR